jgi:hypothetical protein
MAAPDLAVVGWGSVVDGVGSMAEVFDSIERATEAGLSVTRFEIASAAVPWGEPLAEGVLRCASAPLEVMLRARSLLASGVADLVVVTGRDHIRSTYRNDRSARHRLTRAYGEYSFLDGYERLTKAFLARNGVTVETFRHLSECLFANYARTWIEAAGGPRPLPAARWFEPINDVFRGVDCANPSIDYDGCIVLARDERSSARYGNATHRVIVRGLGVEQACPDGIEHVSEIASYEHLRRAFDGACEEAGVPFRERFTRGEALLEAYTCYPVVPLAFLRMSGLVTTWEDVPAFLGEHAITVTGGLNLARAPGNNTTVRALIDIVERLGRPGTPTLAGVHSLGALGHVQAFCILERCPEGSA